MIISRYLLREVMNALLIVIGVLLLAFLSQQIVRYLNYVALGKIPTSVLLQLVSFEVPYLLALLLPLGLYLGILLAYGRLYADQEMTVLQMSGFDQKKIWRLTVRLAIAVACVVLVLMAWINPLISAQREQMMKKDESTIRRLQTILPGRFQASPDGRQVMYVEKLSRNHERAHTVFIAEEVNKPGVATEQSAWRLVLADQGYQTHNAASEQFFVTTDGYRYEGVPGQNDYRILQYKKYALRIPQNNLHVSHLAVETWPTFQLWHDYANPKRAAELQWRISIALTTLILTFFAVPLSVVLPRKGRYFALLPAIVIYIIYINLLFAARHWVEQSVVPIWLGMWWVHVVMLFLILMPLWVLKRYRQ